MEKDMASQSSTGKGRTILTRRIEICRSGKHNFCSYHSLIIHSITSYRVLCVFFLNSLLYVCNISFRLRKAQIPWVFEIQESELHAKCGHLCVWIATLSSDQRNSAQGSWSVLRLFGSSNWSQDAFSGNIWKVCQQYIFQMLYFIF